MSAQVRCFSVRFCGVSRCESVEEAWNTKVTYVKVLFLRALDLYAYYIG